MKDEKLMDHQYFNPLYTKFMSLGWHRWGINDIFLTVFVVL